MQNKKGISLIVLVITIIVMIILAAAIIISLDNSGIINKANQAVTETDLAQVRHLATLAWSEAYLEENLREADDIKAYIETKLTESKIDLNQYNLDVTKNGVDVTLKNGGSANQNPSQNSQVPENWKENVVNLVDNVPIPKGFVASSVTGEDKKSSGLVIYQGTEAVTEQNVDEARKTRNQYVWVPVEDFSKFVRQKFGAEGTIYNQVGAVGDSSVSNSDYPLFWEAYPNIDTTYEETFQQEEYGTCMVEQWYGDESAQKCADRYIKKVKTSDYISAETLAEVQAMYESIKEYKGFYMARYEAGVNNQRNFNNHETSDEIVILEPEVYSVMGKLPYSFIGWGKLNYYTSDGAVEVARSIYPNTDANKTGVVSTLTYGIQWDATIQWLIDTGAVSSIVDNTQDGNYTNTVIQATDFNEGAKYSKYTSYTDSEDNEINELEPYKEVSSTTQKDKGAVWFLSTGALKLAKQNNIYDLAGNVDEWTMEFARSESDYYLSDPVYRGGDGSIALRNCFAGNGEYFSIGFRPSLYIKK